MKQLDWQREVRKGGLLIKKPFIHSYCITDIFCAVLLPHSDFNVFTTASHWVQALQNHCVVGKLHSLGLCICYCECFETTKDVVSQISYDLISFYAHNLQ